VSKRRVVVTGLGMITPLGNNVSETWEGILKGRSGIALLDHFDTTDFTVRIGGSIKDLALDDYIPRKDQKKMDPFIHYGIAAGVQAIEDSGLDLDKEDANRIGVAIGSGIGGLPGIEKGTELFHSGGPRRISPFYVPSNIINMISGHLSIMYGFKGPNFSITTACTTGTHNIGDAARLIEYGDADVMVAGGSEMATSRTGLAGFAAARALSTRNDEPESASRPWDKDRDGFVLSDGAGVMVLEEYEFAKKREAKIYAELIGYGMSADAFHMTAPSKNGQGAASCMQNALRNGKITSNDIQYINAHGTSTPAGDIAETIAVKTVFEGNAKKIAISSTKSMIGHLLGAAGGVEAIFSVLAIRDQIAPPTINLENQDPECDLDYVPNVAREMKIETTLSNSFGFGGTNGSLIFKRII
jgi:3-oxoacyl-[acyl-carrier-protein] synthase II